MLVTFSCSATSDLVMFSDVARQLLEVVDKSPTARGVLIPAEFSEAIYRLEHLPHSLQQAEVTTPPPFPPAESTSEPHDEIGLDIRAFPLAGMIRLAEAENVPILWFAKQDFFADA